MKTTGEAKPKLAGSIIYAELANTPKNRQMAPSLYIVFYYCINLLSHKLEG